MSLIVSLLKIPAELLRYFAVLTIFFFGLSLLIPGTQIFIEKIFSKISKYVPQQTNREGFLGGILIGLSIGLLWTPCVGPILASVISLAITGTVSSTAFFITLAYSLGTAIPMFIILKTGRRIFVASPGLISRTKNIQQVFGVIMIITAIMIFFNLDRSLQSYLLDKFPQYGVGLTKIEDNEKVRSALEDMGGKVKQQNLGRPMFKELQNLGPAPELIVGGQWFNLAGNKPFTLQDKRGEVILIDFWTYTCINCIRTLPYLSSWHEKYKDKGLTIIGVHSPEFEFEKEAQNVQAAIDDFKIPYPVMQDNDFATWRAYNNRYWPAKYLIDKDGNIRYYHFGEGDYDKTESAIQALLAEAGQDLSQMKIGNEQYKTVSATPELYLGYGRAEHLSSPEKIIPNKLISYTKPSFFPDNSFAFEGGVVVGEEYSAPSSGSKLYLKFEAKDVYLVMRSKNGQSGSIRVILDGDVVGSNGGEDVKNGIVTIQNDRLYKLIKLSESGRHELKLEFLDGNVELFAFTFG